MSTAENKPVVKSEVLDALSGLKEIRKGVGKWVDDSEGEGFIKTCEALECFFTPIDVYPENLNEEYILDADILKEDLLKIMDTIDKEGWPPSPYLPVKEITGNDEFEKGKTDFTDAVSFALTTLIDGYFYINKFYKDDPRFTEEFKQKLLEYVKLSLQWLEENVYIEKVDDKEYAYYSAMGSKNNPDGAGFQSASIYFSYTGAVALAYGIKYKNLLKLSKEEIQKISHILNAIRDWLFSTVKETEDGDIIVSYKTIKNNEKFFSSPAPLLVYVILTDAFYRNDAGLQSKNDDEYLEKIVKMVKRLKDTYYNDEEYSDLLDSGVFHMINIKSEHSSKLKYEDRYIAFLLLEAFIYLYDLLIEKGKSSSYKNLLDLNEITETIYKLYDDLKSAANFTYKLSDHKEISGLWGRHHKVTIYLNERAIESLAEYSRFEAMTKEKFFQIGGIEMSEFRDLILKGLVQAFTRRSIQNQITEIILDNFKDYERLKRKSVNRDIDDKKVAEEIHSQIKNSQKQ